MPSFPVRRSGHRQTASGPVGYVRLFDPPKYAAARQKPKWAAQHNEVRKALEKSNGVPATLKRMSLEELNMPAANGQTLLHLAVIINHVAVVKYLLQRKVEINTKDRYKEGPLLASCRLKSPEILGLLLREKPHINPKNNKDETPVHLAAMTDKLAHIKLLCKAGARLNYLDKKTRTPLYWAEKAGHTETAKYLRSKGAQLV